MNLKKTLIAFFTFLGGIYFFLEFLLPKKIGSLEFGHYHDQISLGVQTIGTMAIGIGIINILLVHGSNIIKSRKGWLNSFALILGLFLVLGIYGRDFINTEKRVDSWKSIETLELFVKQIDIDFKKSKTPTTPRLKLLKKSILSTKAKLKNRNSFLFTDPKNLPTMSSELLESLTLAEEQTEILLLAYNTTSDHLDQDKKNTAKSNLLASLNTAKISARSLSDLNYKNSFPKHATHFVDKAFYESLGAAMFSLLAFYIASAAYRSFRIRSLESSIMMFTALLVILGQIPQGPLYIYDGLPHIRLWLMKYLNTPAFRAIFFGSSIAGLAMAIRMWLSLERSPLSADE